MIERDRGRERECVQKRQREGERERERARNGKRERKERKILGLKTNRKRKSERRRKENERGRVREKNTKNWADIWACGQVDRREGHCQIFTLRARRNIEDVVLCHSSNILNDGTQNKTQHDET